MEINDLRYFVRALELESISRAADALGITQPALSRHIRLLESELQQALLIRTGRGVQPTEAGRRFAAEAIRILEEVDALGGTMRSGVALPNGSVSLALPASIVDGLLPQIYAALGRQFPDIQLKAIEAISSTSSDWLRNRTIDLAIQYDRTDVAGLQFEKLIDEPLCLISSAETGTPDDESVGFSTIEKIELILPGRSSGLRRMLEIEAVRCNIRLRVAVEIDSVSAMKNLVAAGLGHTILPQFSIVREVASGILIARRIREPLLTRGLTIARLEHRTPTAAMTRVIQVIRAVAQGYAFGSK